MSGKVAVCSVCPKENQQIEAVIKLPKEKRAVIHGTVLDCNGCPVADADVYKRQILFPAPVLCTDNAAMIGSAAYFELMNGKKEN